MKRSFRSFVVATALLMATTGIFASCNPGDNSGSVGTSESTGMSSSSEETEVVNSLTITNKPEGNQLYVGADKSVTLGYTTDPADAAVSVKWSSSDDATATVDENGKVTGIKPGSVVITATAEGTNVSAKLPLTVLEYVEPKPVTAISISGMEKISEMKRGETKAIEIVSEPADCDSYEIEWTYDKELIEIVEVPEGFNIVAKAYGSTDVVATVKETEIKDSISVTVEGDVDYENGIMTETFSRGTLDPKGVYYTSADKTTSAQKPMYHGTFFEVGARANSTTPSDVVLADEALEWTIHTPQYNERVIFWYNGEIDSESDYIVRIPVTAKSVTEDSAIDTKLYYGYRVKASEEDLGLSYNHTAADATLDNSMKYDLNVSGEALGEFKTVGETIYLDVRVASGWNGEVWVGCHGAKNQGVTGKLTLKFDNIQVFKVSELQYGGDVETFETATVANKTAAADKLTVASVGDALDVVAGRKPRECGPEASFAPATGNLLRWTTNRVYKENISPAPDGGHPKIIFKFRNIDAAKGYTVEIPLQAVAALIETNQTFKVEDMEIRAYSADTADAGKLLGTGKVAFNGGATVLKLEIAADTGWDGTICLRVYNENAETKADSAKIYFYFDNITLKEIDA